MAENEVELVIGFLIFLQLEQQQPGGTLPRLGIGWLVWCVEHAQSCGASTGPMGHLGVGLHPCGVLGALAGLVFDHGVEAVDHEDGCGDREHCARDVEDVLSGHGGVPF